MIPAAIGMMYMHDMKCIRPQYTSSLILLPLSRILNNISKISSTLISPMMMMMIMMMMMLMNSISISDEDDDDDDDGGGGGDSGDDNDDDDVSDHC